MRHRLLTALSLLLVSSASYAIDEPHTAYLRLCAELDLAALSEIEMAANSGEISGEKIAAAFFSVMAARNACGEGRVDQAISIYDDVSLY